jgi:hypothetical protein
MDKQIKKKPMEDKAEQSIFPTGGAFIWAFITWIAILTQVAGSVLMVTVLADLREKRTVTNERFDFVRYVALLSVIGASLLFLIDSFAFLVGGSIKNLEKWLEQEKRRIEDEKNGVYCE